MCLTTHARRAAGLLACAALTALVACGGSDAQPNTPVVIIDEPAQNNGQQPMEPCQAGQPGCDAPAPIVAALIKDRGQLTLIHTPSDPIEATGLAFNPERADQLWVVQRPAPSSSPCTTTLQTAEGCAALEGRMTIIHDPGQPQVRFEQLVDPNSWHFLRRPTGLAFGAPGTFATCGEERTGNFLDQAGDFIGPTLWSSDMMIFAQDPGVDAAGDPLNGSHLDMLHATPWCMGIAHEKDNIYWAFNGQNGALDPGPLH